MGRDWLYKASGSRSTRGGGKSSITSSTGCMTAILNMFDTQQHHHPSFISQTSITHDDYSTTSFSLQGIEAPRNSLESPPDVKQQTNFNIPPVGGIQVETKRSTFSDDTSCVTKTPSVVARLMGLDLLPEYSSPRPSSSSDHHRTHSLPATPRLSTASPDHKCYHRHVDKENNNNNNYKDLVMNNRQDDDHRTSTRNMKQKKSARRINRIVGADITNRIVSPARNKHRRRDKDLDLLKPKVSPAREKKPLSNPPKLRLLDVKNNLEKPTYHSHPSSLSLKKMKEKTHETPSLKLRKDTKIKRIERYDLHQHEKEFFSTRKLPDDHVWNIVKNRRKKDMTSSSSTATRLSQNKVSLPSNLNSSYNSNDTHNLKSLTATATAAAYSFSDGEGRLWLTAVEAEVEDAVVEIESEIFKNLVDEIVTETMASGSDRVRSLVLFT